MLLKEYKAEKPSELLSDLIDEMCKLQPREYVEKFISEVREWETNGFQSNRKT